MVWDSPTNLTASTGYIFHFRLLAPNGAPAPTCSPTWAWPATPPSSRADGTVFAHVHPEGSAAMAAVMLANYTTAPDAMKPDNARSDRHLPPSRPMLRIQPPTPSTSPTAFPAPVTMASLSR